MIKRVAFLHRRLALGGAEAVSLHTAAYFAGEGIKSYFFAMAKNVDEWQKPVEDSEVLLFPRRMFKGGEELDLLIEAIKKNKIELLFIITPIPNLLRRLRNETNCKAVTWLHSTPLWELLDKPQHKMAKFRFYPLRLFLPLAKLYWRYYFKAFNQRIYKLYRENFDYSFAYIVLCPQYGSELVEKLGLSEDKLKKVYPIINTLAPVQSMELKKKKEIIFLGRLSYADKRVDRLIDIWAKIYQDLPEWSLKIYGRGKEEKRLKKQIQRLGLERISLEGYVRDTEAVLRRSAILCQTSSYEGVPMSMLEAQSQGVVPIAFAATSGIRFVIGEGAGVLIPPFELDVFASELKKLCLDEAYRAELQRHCVIKSQTYSDEANRATWQRLFASASEQTNNDDAR